ncbi:hypothetical protein ACFL13_02700 [Patescibacteria group bacterium]
MRNKLLLSLKRNLERKEIYERVYLGLFLITLVYLGIFGIFPLLKQGISRYKTVVEMRRINDILLQKIEVLEEKSPSRARYRGYLSMLKYSFPKEPDPQNFLGEVVSAVNFNFFEQKSFSTHEVGDTSLSLEVEVVGSEKRIGSLIGSFENLYRLTSVKGFTFVKEEIGILGRVEMEIFYVRERL